MPKNYRLLILLLALVVGGISQVWGQNAQVEVLVVDSLTEKPLGYALWQLEGSRYQGTTGQEGTIRMLDVPPGRYRLQVYYLGYRPEKRVLDLESGERLSLEMKMVQVALDMEEIVVTAQLDGQRAAIQKQINADGIVNIVSKDRIEDIPDQNAAETVGRIPGVSLQREGGEATKVSIRGLSPRYNSITINGERIPATDGNDRSVDLSMISTDALGGIEVYKSITPDQDGDAVGGTVNFLIKQAKRGLRGSFRGSTGYNQQQDEFGQYRGSFSLSNRFFDHKLGVILTGNYQRANRSSDVLTASYVTTGEDTAGGAIINVEDINLADNLEIRRRYGGSLTLDYELERGVISISSFAGFLDRDEDRYRTRYRPEDSRKEYDYRRRILHQFTWNNTMAGTYQLGFWRSELSYGASYALTERNTPTDNTARFRETGAFTGQVDETSLEAVVAAAKNDLSRTFFQQDRLDTEAIGTRKYTVNADWKIPFQIRDKALSGFFKAGGKFRRQWRDRESFRLWSAFGAIDEIAEAYPDRFTLNSDDRIEVSQFFGDHQVGEFLQGRFPFEFGPTLDADKLAAFSETYQDEFYSEDERLRLQNYYSAEEIRAGYVMGKLTFFERLTLIPGVRVENTQTQFEGLYGRSFELEGQVLISSQDTVGTQNYTEFLPMVQAKYQVKPWMDVRLAATRTLARPNFFDLVPWQQINDINRVVERGNAALKHTTVWNYDAFLSFYNQYGLFTVGGFHKRLRNVDYTRVSRDTEPGSATTGYRLITRNNLPEDVTVLGAEIDLQGNLSFLPAPFNGLVISANYTLIRSQTRFPQLRIVDGEPPFFIPTVVDTFRAGVLPDQPNNVLNVSLGYERGGFSARLSLVRQGTTLQFVGDREELDGYFRAFSRWDLAIKQNLKKGMSVFFNFNNISNTPEFAFLAADQRFPIREEYYGWTADLGLKYVF
jgi:TonB-dependent receptor